MAGGEGGEKAMAILLRGFVLSNREKVFDNL